MSVTQLDQRNSAKRGLLRGLLVCPFCSGGLEEDEERYACLSCRKTYPVRNSIPRFLVNLSDGEQQVRRSFDLEHVRYLDSHYLHLTPMLVEQWLRDVQLPPEFFKDKLVLDAGCGSGRWTYAMASLGATVVAVDFTDAGVEVTQRATAHMDTVAVLQADIFHLPFRPEQFDFVLSWGVLHHTPDTKRAFDCVAPLVKRGGRLYVMVYEKHNPWKFLCTDLLRWLLRRFSEERRYRLCKSLIIRNRRWCSYLGHVLICSYCPASADELQVSSIQLGLYDAYSPLYNHLHTRGEVLGWFEAHHFDRLTCTRPVKNTRALDILRYGECDGSINVRGVRL